MTERVESPANHIIREARQLAFDELYRAPQTEFSLVMDDSFPEKFVDELSRLEVYNKHLFRPNTYLHKWWARRCGSTYLERAYARKKLMARSTGNRPAEIFGYPIENRSAEAEDAREKHWCLFANRPCDKKSRLIDYPWLMWALR